MKTKDQYLIQCPACNKEFPIEEVLKERFHQEFEQKLQLEVLRIKQDSQSEISRIEQNALSEVSRIERESQTEKDALVQKAIADTIAVQQQIHSATESQLKEKIANLEQYNSKLSDNFNEKLQSESSRIEREAREESEQRILQLQQNIEDSNKSLATARKQITELEQAKLDYQTLQNQYDSLSSNTEIEIQKAKLAAQQAARAEYDKIKEEEKKLKEQELSIQREQHERELTAIKSRTNEEAKLQNEQEIAAIKFFFQQQLDEQDEKHRQELAQKDEAVNQAKRRTEELQKSLGQGSMQIQGEAQEKYLARRLKEQTDNRFDTIAEKRPGISEADIKQVVKEPINNILTECGIILYESKNTKSFSKDWLAKLKEDGQTAKADILVLVTQAMPANNNDLHRLEDIWICPVSYFNIVSKTLRRGLVDTYRAGLSQQNRQEKMDKLYDFMLGQGFKRYMKGIIDGINIIKKSYEDEKIALTRVWKVRERQFQNISENAFGLHASFQAIESNIPGIDDINILQLADITEDTDADEDADANEHLLE